MKLNKYCVLGRSLPHTLSPFLYQQLGLNYQVVELPDEAALKVFALKKEYSGYNVTIPYKKEIMKYLDVVDVKAREVGAVNTVLNKDGKSYGYNTDVEGMRLAIKKAGITIWGKNVMILGTGGTSATAEYLAKKEAAASIVKVSREGEINYTNCYDFNCTDLIINTTPVGMFPMSQESPIDLSRFHRLVGVYDVVYNPIKTKLVEEAEKMGIPSANGLYMLVAQAKLAAEIYMGKSLINSLTDDLYIATLVAHKNIILVGMPGSGKTTIGKKIAEIMNRPFIDLDEEIEKRVGMSIPDFFAENEEKAFRDIESIVINDFSSKLGFVIATGGGAVIRSENRDALRRNGYIVWIRREFKDLELEGRPLSKDLEALRRIESERMHLYADISDSSVINNRDSLAVASEIKEIYEDDISH